MFARTLTAGSALVAALVLVGCGSSSSSKGKTPKLEQQKQDQDQSKDKQTPVSTAPVKQTAPTKGEKVVALPKGVVVLPDQSNSVPPSSEAGFQYRPITHLNVCVLTDRNERRNHSYSQCIMITADGDYKLSALNLGRDADDDISSIAVSVQAFSMQGANPITSLDMCIQAESIDTRCTGLKLVTDNVEYATEAAVGDNRGDILTVAIAGTAFYSPSAVPMTRFNLCAAGEGRYECTGYVTADGVTRTSNFSTGDGRVNLRNVGLKFSSLSH